MTSLRCGAVLATALCVVGCTSKEDEVPGPTCNVSVAPSADDQAAVENAFITVPVGGTVCLAAGTYHFKSELSLAVDNVTVRGAGNALTVLEFSNQDVGANGLQIMSDGVRLEALGVSDTPGDGIRATNVKNVAFVDVAVRWTTPASVDNGAYGLYPVGCDGVRIERCIVTGSRDAGIYVGQSQHVLVSASEAFGNVAGIEIENTTDAEVVGNAAHDNTAGILVFNLPDLPVQDGQRAKVHGNTVTNNNLTSFAVAGTVVSKVPRGVGMLIVASDANEIHENTVTGNVSLGIAMLSYLPVVFGPTTDPNYDHFAERNFVHDNTLTNNGTQPQGVVALATPDRPIPEIVWDGCTDPAAVGDQRNCLSNNPGADYLNADQCSTPSAQSHDAAPVTCTYDPLPSQNP